MRYLNTDMAYDDQRERLKYDGVRRARVNYDGTTWGCGSCASNETRTFYGVWEDFPDDYDGIFAMLTGLCGETYTQWEIDGQREWVLEPHESDW